MKTSSDFVFVDYDVATAEFLVTVKSSGNQAGWVGVAKRFAYPYEAMNYACAFIDGMKSMQEGKHLPTKHEDLLMTNRTIEPFKKFIAESVSAQKIKEMLFSDLELNEKTKHLHLTK